MPRATLHPSAVERRSGLAERLALLPHALARDTQATRDDAVLLRPIDRVPLLARDDGPRVPPTQRRSGLGKFHAGVDARVISSAVRHADGLGRFTNRPARTRRVDDLLVKSTDPVAL